MQSKTSDEIEFVEIFRRPGMPMSATVRVVDPGQVKQYIVSDRTVPVDRWLNEGLAQIFEVGQLDGDTLRIDAPNTASLVQLQRDLASNSPLSLAELLVSTDRDFLAAHARIATARRYAHAWGLAYYLTIEEPRLTPESLAAFLAPSHRAEPERLEALIGKPLREFEVQWREAMPKLSSP